jgi:hypothetical protein
VVLEPWKLAGVVEEVGLRSVKLRAINGDLMRVHNSQIMAARLLPRGVREVSIELFVNDEVRGRELVEEVAGIVPIGPTQFVQPPTVVSSAPLDGHIAHVVARATVFPEREWLAYELLPSLIKERAPEGLVVHGPVVMDVDDVAQLRMSRSLARTAG